MLVGRINLKPETVKPETGLIPMLVGRTFYLLPSPSKDSTIRVADGAVGPG
jgi:hypothetical protein